MKLKICIVLFVGLLMVSCEDSVNIFIDLEKNYAAYCMIDTRAEVNLVRLYKFYYNGVSRKFTGNTSVILSESKGKEYYLQDTLIAGQEDCLIYKIPKNMIKRNGYYRLTVLNDSLGNHWADCYVPKNSGMEVYPSYNIQTGSIMINLSFPKASHDVIYFRLLMSYDLTQNGVTERKIRDIPYKLFISDKSFYYDPEKEIWLYSEDEINAEIYPEIQNAGEITLNSLLIDGDRFIRYYSDTMFQYVLKNMSLKYGGQNVRIKGGMALFYSIDKNYYYQYYLSGNMSTSVRLDEGYFYTNFKGGENNYGFFGAMAVDTVRFNIPHSMTVRFGLIDDQ